MYKYLIIFTLFINITGITNAGDSFPYDPATAHTPVDGLDSSKIPLLVHLGFDDNQYPDGLEWVRTELLAGKKNPDGEGNLATFDGQPIKASFYIMGQGAEGSSGKELKEQWRALYDDGHEIGNHTWTHEDFCHLWTQDQANNELHQTNMMITNVMGIPKSHIYGFRTPFLDHGSTIMRAVLNENLLYDCTFDDQTQGWLVSKGLCPMTLDNSGPGFMASYKFAGLWEVPFGVLCRQEGGNGTDMAFDSGMWPKGVSASQFLNFLKWTFDRKYDGGIRSPFSIGLHSDYYSEYNTINGCNVSVGGRRQLLIDFVDYVLSHEDARIVRGIDLIRWRREAVQVDDLSLSDKYATPLDKPSEDFASSNLSITIDAGSGSEINPSTGKFKADYKIAKGSYALLKTETTKSFAGVKTLKITYTSDAPLKLSLVQNGVNPENAYATGFPSCSEKKTFVLPFNAWTFRQPVRTSSEAEFDMDKVKGITLEPAPYDAAAEGSFDVSELIFYGAGNLGSNTAIISDAFVNKGIYSIKYFQGKLSLQVPSAGKHVLSIYSLNGTRIYRDNKLALIKGRNVIEVPKCASGAYIFKISGPEGVLTSGILVD